MDGEDVGNVPDRDDASDRSGTLARADTHGARGPTRAAGERPAFTPGQLAVTRDSRDRSAPLGAPDDDGWSPPHQARVGRYVTLERLGAGGMGVVLAAYDPQLDRKVALKLLLTKARVSPHAHLRLQREAQALAKLDHRNVVGVHDVGVHDGQVFVAMEFIDGQTLSEWLAEAENRRPWPEIVRVFLEAGQGLAAAHAQGLIHRDFKPDNVMIDRQGRVRVMDFGIARARDDDELFADDAVDLAEIRAPIGRLTRDGTILGTPAYMSYEQLIGAEVDARADQFSFCVALYEALYGVAPFAGDTLPELIERIREGTPAEPPRGARVPRWIREALLRGLAASPAARWPSMDALLAALADDPSKRRRRRARIAGAVVLVGLGLAGAATLVRAGAQTCAGMEAQLAGVWDPTRRAAVKRALLATRAAYAEDTWRLVEGRLDRYAGAWVATREGMCAATRAGEQSAALLDLRMACLDGQLHFARATIDELLRADAEIVAAGARIVAALPDPASCSREAVLSAQQLAPRDPAVADEVAALDEALATARAKESAGRYDEALALAEEVVGAAERLGDEPLLARARLRHGAILDKSGQYEGAAAELERALTSALAQSMRDESAEAASQLLYVIGYQQARVEDGQRWVAIARALARASGSPRAAARAAIHAGTLEFTRGHYAQAHELWEEGLAHLEADPTADDLDLLSPLGNLAIVARRQGRYADARRHSARALEIAERELGPLHPDLADILNDMGAVANEEGRLDAARVHWERALEIGGASLGPDHPSLAASLSNLGLVATNTGDLEAARRYLERALAIDEAALGPDHPIIASDHNNLGQLERRAGDPARALELFTSAIAIREEALGLVHPGLIYPLASRGELALETGDPAAALRDFRRAREIADASLEADDPLAARVQASLGRALLASGDATAAVGHLEPAIDRLSEFDSGSDELAPARFALAQALWQAPTPSADDRRRARGLAALAAATYEAQGEGAAARLAEVHTWLDAHTVTTTTGDAPPTR